MSIKSFIVALIVSLAASVNVNAEDLGEAVEAMHRGDFAIAYCIMRPMAESGNAEAQYNIGWMYLNGYGLRVDDRHALEWWEKASGQGHTDASFSIGMLYSLGEGKVAKDLNRAIDYYMIAAQDGQEDAIQLLRYMMMRNDPEISGRIHSIVNQHGSMFGAQLQVNAKKLNAREGPSVKDKVLAQLLNGQSVLELSKKGKWSQVVILGEGQFDQTVWVFNPLLKIPDQKPSESEPTIRQNPNPATNPAYYQRPYDNSYRR